MIIVVIIWILIVELLGDKLFKAIDSYNKSVRYIVRIVLYAPAFYYALPSSIHPSSLSFYFKEINTVVDSVTQSRFPLDKFGYYLQTSDGDYGINEFEYYFGRPSEMGEDEGLEIEFYGGEPSFYSGDSIRKERFSSTYKIIDNPISELKTTFKKVRSYYRLDYGRQLQSGDLLFGFKANFQNDSLIKISKPYYFYSELTKPNEKIADSVIVDIEDTKIRLYPSDVKFVRKINLGEGHQDVLIHYRGKEMNNQMIDLFESKYCELRVYKTDSIYQEEIFRCSENYFNNVLKIYNRIVDWNGN